ncbi:unnamed protein product [Hymenolepis diminuta]|uniref:Non-specific serine/threonine protein kinase n=1 Tax=Hymenolepis diminuta TaxID=6216 RepID=A0A564Z332_HYMDI|nr:unnamed protein product [Hymenolepis diminuta]
MPSFLLAACRVFERNGKCRGYKIDSLPEAQKWVAMEFNDCGHTLHGELPSCAVGRLSVFAQTVLAMAVAERQLCLEHRDLHMDNVLIRPRLKGNAMGAGCDTDAPSSTLDGTVHQPCAGPSVSIIDFTFSRLNMNATYLSSNKTLLKEVQNGASGSYEKRFKPRGNCIWLGVIAEYLKTAEPTVTQCEVHHSSVTNLETKWNAILNLLKTSKSAVDFVKKAQTEAKFLFL